jgi:cysteine desulfuration protein SufE
MPTIKEIEEEIISEFSLFDDPMDRYEYIIEIGNKMPNLAEQFKTEENVVKGCQSKVWLHSYVKEGNIFFEADSNTVITKGIIGLLVRVLSNHNADEIINAELSFIDAIGLRSHLSSQRSNGLNAMIKQMKLYALAFKTKEVNS